MKPIGKTADYIEGGRVGCDESRIYEDKEWDGQVGRV